MGFVPTSNVMNSLIGPRGKTFSKNVKKKEEKGQSF
jgi:hypothetical protein